MSSPTPKYRELYPPIEPFDDAFLRVSDLHTIHYEQVGNPAGKPALFLHGGPGGGLADYYRQFFDPKAYRVILIDQRGSGKSNPHASLEENTTWTLVSDIEQVRQHLNIDKWVVFGGSWGSTLAIAYAEKHPQRVKALILRGIFLLRSKEVQWFYQEGASWLFPDAWEKFIEPIPPAERNHLLSAYHRRLTGTNEVEKIKCATAWSVWEMTTSRLYVDPEYIKHAADDPHFALAFARIEAHYFVNAGFMTHDGQLLTDANIIKDIPGVIVQGRYDLVCPAQSAWDLHKAWPKSELHWVPDAGHSAKEPGIIHLLIEATDRFRNL